MCRRHLVVINDTINLFLKTAISVLVISNHVAVSECCLIELLPYSRQWRQREYNFGGDAEGIKEQLQVSLLDDNVGAIEIVVSPCEVCAKATEL